MEKKSIKSKTGRPEHAATAVTRRKVAIAAGGGMLHEQIALALGISTPTLRKYYKHELSIGASQCRMAVLQAVYETAKRKGTTSAAKAYLANAPEFEAPPMPEGEESPVRPPAPVAAPAAAPEPQPAKVGKKEQAALDATSAAEGTEWADLLPRGGTILQ
jgi:hypothetical protein